MDHLQHTDGNSILGAIVSAIFAFVSISDLEMIVRIIAGLVAIVVGITTIWYNIVKIRKLNLKPKENE